MEENNKQRSEKLREKAQQKIIEEAEKEKAKEERLVAESMVRELLQWVGIWNSKTGYISAADAKKFI